MWHAIRFVTLVWNGAIVSAIIAALVTDGNLHVDAEPAHDLSALSVVLFLIGCAASLALALKAQIKTISVKGHSS